MLSTFNIAPAEEAMPMSARSPVARRKLENPAQEAMVTLMVTAGHLVQGLEEVCALHGITHDQYNVLRILRGVHPGGHPRYAVAERLINRAPDVTRLLDRLEREKLVERRRSEEDRRLSISRITDRGLKLLEHTDPEILAVHERFAGELSAKDLDRLTNLLSRLR
jgi:DNA-binding MarR family transcriptional regulator